MNTINNKSNKIEVNKIIIEGFHLVDSPGIIANLFIEFFVTAPLQLLNSNLDPHTPALAHCYHQQRSMFLTPVIQAEVAGIIK
ncbi:hypothetical protein J6590_050039, partial [Homalodisca vitripennis]